MRGLARLLACWSTAFLAQPLKILPPSLDDSAQRIFFGSSVTLDGLLGGGAEVYSINFGGQQSAARCLRALAVSLCNKVFRAA